MKRLRLLPQREENRVSPADSTALCSPHGWSSDSSARNTFLGATIQSVLIRRPSRSCSETMVWAPAGACQQQSVTSRRRLLEQVPAHNSTEEARRQRESSRTLLIILRYRDILEEWVYKGIGDIHSKLFDQNDVNDSLRNLTVSCNSTETLLSPLTLKLQHISDSLCNFIPLYDLKEVKTNK